MAEPGPRILVVDTATRRGVVAAVLGQDVLAQRVHDQPTTHAERLFGMVEEVLADAGWIPSDVQLLAVGVGPGSFTGVRVGMAAAKGIGFALSIPLLGVGSLEAMAHAARRRLGPGPVVALIDAKKGEVFVACHDEDGRLRAGPDHLPRQDVDAWLEAIGGSPVVVGEIGQTLGLRHGRWHRDPECDLPGPGSVAAMAWTQWAETGRDQIDSLEPMYVRPPDITRPAAPAGLVASNSTKRADSA